jgi:hydrogenase maturation protein HypF
MTTAGRRIEVRGTVQGVGFRPWVYRLAADAGIGGRVRNDGAGVIIEAFGVETALDAFVEHLQADSPRAARIDALRWLEIPEEPVEGFEIVASRMAGERRVSIPADLATCAPCVAEINDLRNRRYRYPFTNCTDCGPRFAIALDVPYDRQRTTMKAFTMCDDCRREYESIGDRRFHAQPNACPACGPQLRLVSADGEVIAGVDPVHAAAVALASGEILCLKGIGGFHLVCDATSQRAVTELRRRKRREAKPLAVMVADLHAAEALAVLGEEERQLLTSTAAPIVLLRRRPDSGLADAVAPGNPYVGVMLPYSPLHHLLLREAGRPLVMTSGNLSEEPIVYRDDEVMKRLAAVADVFVLHDREIVTRCEDSVARVIAGAPTLLRRARGYVPGAVPLARFLDGAVLACGGHLKNTFCLAAGDTAYLGPHIGDLDNLAAVESFEQSIERMERFLGIAPEVIAHDLHPLYASTAYALQRPGRAHVAVQHHHAHVVSAMAEHGLRGPVLGVAYDGTGYGTDGTAWGGEILRADECGYERLATFRPIALAGGEAAIRSVWRIALALLDDAFDGHPPLRQLPAFADVPASEIDVVRRMMATGVNAPQARGVGRYFDAVGVLLLAKTRARFEGEVAMGVEHVAAAEPGEAYPFTIDRSGSLPAIDLRPTLRALVSDLLDFGGIPRIASRFHATLIAATVECVANALRAAGAMPVVLTGGCFQNVLLAEGLSRRLAPFADVYLHGNVPPGDGGLALGQAVIADAVASGQALWGEMGRPKEERRCA